MLVHISICYTLRYAHIWTLALPYHYDTKWDVIIVYNTTLIAYRVKDANFLGSHHSSITNEQVYFCKHMIDDIVQV